MIPSIVVRGTGAVHQLREIADRARDASPAWDGVADLVFQHQGRFWLTEYAGKTDKQKRKGRNPRFMEETGSLRRAATHKGAGNRVDARPAFVLVEITHPLARLQEARGRKVLDEPGTREARQMAQHVADYILTGR